MKMSQLIGERFKERPSECGIDSHALMVRGGYIQYVAGGIYSALPPLRRILHKLEQIIREEMEMAGAQEVTLPVVLPASLWQASGRYGQAGPELLRFRDRGGSELLLAMTHEEAAVSLVREYGKSYQKYPFFLYQIQTKFRDEARPRGGLIRAREFTMKDGYSFHTSQADLEGCFSRCQQAYARIFSRAGLPETRCVLSDSGMMGGSVSREFILPTPVGEDTIALCSCGYGANREAIEARQAGQMAEAGAPQEDGRCPACGRQSLQLCRGIELGHIFQLGDRYTRAMGMCYLDENGESRYPLMGCYGIGLGRLAAAICEAHHDRFGPIWPLTVAPWQVHLCAVRADEPPVQDAAGRLYRQLQQRGYEVLYDDRRLRAGALFADADLLGCPIRLSVSPRGLGQGTVELQSRDRRIQRELSEAALWEELQKLLKGAGEGL